MRLRWAAAGMIAASEQSRSRQGLPQLPVLVTALRHAIGADDLSALAVTA